MERFYSQFQRESILLGYDPQSQRTSTNPSTPHRNPDVDFNDVFGGPPRWSPLQEIRHNFCELQDSGGTQTEEEPEAPSCPWPREREKPVFGEENGNRRRYPNSEFFNDIFGGDESPSMSSTPRNRDWDPFSTVMSPAPPLPSAAEPSASSSLPEAFSLPARLTKGMDLPAFSSRSPARSRNSFKNINDGTGASNGRTFSDSHLSRISTQGTPHKEESKNGLKPSYRQSVLSQEFSNLSISDKAEKGSNVDLSSSDVSPSTNSDKFHFSIYKWASRGVPLLMPLRAERSSRTKDEVKIQRCSSTKEWMFSEITTQNNSPKAYNGSSLTENRKRDESTSITTQIWTDPHQIVKQIFSAKAQSHSLSSLQTVMKGDPGGSTSWGARLESSSHSVSETGFKGNTEAASVTKKPDSKSLHSLFSESDKKQDYDEMTRLKKGEENKAKSTEKSSAICDATVNPKKQEEKKVDIEGVENGKATSQGSSSLDENMGKGRVKGKVKEFVRIFNQEPVMKPKVDFKSRLRGSIHKQRGSLRTKNEVEGYPNQSKTENSATEFTNMSSNDLSQQDDISASAIPDISFAVSGDKDGSFSGNFMIEVLAQEENEVLQIQDSQEIQVIDKGIQQWSKGKEGNIRSLLSTLQYVLWPECGWKPVPLADIIEGSAVKRAYQRALLCLHPDKLQQKGATSHQKYIAEKVFDTLQEAWTQFNMLGAL